MAKLHGRLQSLSFSGSAVGGIEEGNISLERSALESTDHDDASKTYISGRIGGTIEVSLKLDSGDAGQEALRDNIIDDTGEEACDFRMGDGRKYTCNGFVSAWNPSGPNDNVATISCTIQISGTITEAAV